MSSRTLPKGWFAIDGVQLGERHLENQLLGLDLIGANCRGATILDLGSAEGLISRHLCRKGARRADCVEALASRIEVGERLCHGLPVVFRAGNVEDFPALHATGGQFEFRYDIVLALSILHKLRRPDRLLDYIAGLTKKWLAIRAPGPTIAYGRGKCDLLNIPQTLENRLDMVSEAATYAGSWTAVFRRI